MKKIGILKLTFKYTSSTDNCTHQQKVVRHYSEPW